MSLGTTQLGNMTVGRFIIGGNPFSGFSHQNRERDAEMQAFYTPECIVETMLQAERLGVTAAISRTDAHILRVWGDFRAAGGTLQWIAQTASELPDFATAIAAARQGGASGCYLHGGQMEHYLASGRGEEICRAIDLIKQAGMAAGVAGHVPEIFHWAETHLQVDFYMCSYYHPTERAHNAGHVSGMEEIFDDADRERMVATIRELSRPVIHYKVLAAGRKTPQEAFAFVAQHLRPQDAVCVGVFPRDHPSMLADDLAMLGKLINHEKHERHERQETHKVKRTL